MVTTWPFGPAPFPSCARVFSCRDAAGLVPGARDLTRLQPALAATDQRRVPPGSSRQHRATCRPVSEREHDLAAGRAPLRFGFSDRR